MIKDPKYGIPQLKKFPLPDARHVKSAIRFFNYVPPRYEKQLAAAILRRMKEYGMSFEDFTVGDENRFIKYVPKTYLAHYGTLGMHWGIRRFQPYPSDYHGDGKYTGHKKSLIRKSSNGHLTTKGVKALNKLSRSDGAKEALDIYAARKKKFRDRVGIQAIDEKTDLVKSGTKITRVANEETLSNQRKYVALTESQDSDDYINHPLDLGTNGKEPIYKYSYELKKDIKVAPAEEVGKYVLENYGDTLVKDLKINDRVFDVQFTKVGRDKAVKALKEVGDIKVRELLQESEQYETLIRMRRQKKLDDSNWAIGRAAVGHEALISLMNKNMMTDKANMDEICEEFKARGYDAIVDAEDKFAGYDYPLVLLNPKDALKLKSKEKIYG